MTNLEEIYVNFLNYGYPVHVNHMNAEKNELTVIEAYARDVGRGIARIDNEMIEKLGLSKGDVERKMKNTVQVTVILNEKEIMIMFPNLEGESDMGEVFCSMDSLFHECCLDYFRYCWYGSDVFSQYKLKE